MVSPLLLWVRGRSLHWWRSAVVINSTLAIDDGGGIEDEEDTDDSWSEGTISTVDIEADDVSFSASSSEPDDITFVETFVADLLADSGELA